MAEEKYTPPEQPLDTDTLSALRYVLHNVQGISPVSLATEVALSDDTE